MNKTSFFLIFIFTLASCSSKKQILYLNKESVKNEWSINKQKSATDFVQPGDILDVRIISLVQEAAIPYNKNSNQKNSSIEVMNLEGYLVSKNDSINLPVLGYICTKNLTVNKLQQKIKKILVDNKHLINPSVIIRRLNAKFTVLGEVRNPGTYNYYDQKLNLFQALGYAGDLNIDASRKNITLVRIENGKNKSHKISLLDSGLINSNFYLVQNNDVIVVNPNYSKIKSAGFIGSPTSIASIASLALSITLLLINNN